MAPFDLQEVHDLLVRVAYEAGQIMLDTKPISSGTKQNSSDIFTETDHAIEKLVSTRLLSSYPQFEFIGEETYHPGQKLTDAPTFIIDPIDGTTNFVHNYPAFCISLGVTVGKEPVVGVIYNPMSEELYTSIRGRGAYMTKGGVKSQLPLKAPEPLNDLSTCLVIVEWGYERSGRNFDLKSKVFTKLAASKETGGAMIHSSRTIGSATLSIVQVACGQTDVYWEGGPWAWDVCAAICILVEAGGIMVGANPGDWDCAVDSRKYLAVRGAPSGQKAIVEEMWRIVGDGRLEYDS